MSDSDPIDIPIDRLSVELLEAVMDEFINREGTDYGEYDLSLRDKRARLRKALEQGRARIVFDPVTASTTVMPVR